MSSIARSVIKLSRQAADLPGGVVKRIITLPIGERFFLISITAAIWGAKDLHLAARGGAFAALYVSSGRASEPPMNALIAYLDRSPLGDSIGERAGRLPGLVAVVLAAAAPRRFIGEDAALIAAAVTWFIATTGAAPAGSARLAGAAAAAGRRVRHRARRLRRLQRQLPWGYAYLGALAYHHYDIVYRLRNLGAAPPRLIQTIVLGAELRTIVILGAVLADADMDIVFMIGTALVAIPGGRECDPGLADPEHERRHRRLMRRKENHESRRPRCRPRLPPPAAHR